MNKIYNENCLDTMKRMPDNYIDLTVTSPPYDNLRNYKGYVFDFEQIARELYRVTKKGGVVVWVVNDATVKGSETGTSFKQALYFKEIGFNLHDTMLWCKTGPPLSHNRYEQGFEYMFILSKNTPKVFNGIRDKINKTAGESIHVSQRCADGIVRKTSSKVGKIRQFGLRTNLWFIPPCVSSKERFGHPAPFSEQLANDHIISWSNEGDLVYDPFLGSGTTMKMAKLNKRNCIGSETSKEYCEIAIERIKTGE